mmetsp:Transcript_55371/g.106788  ORF Transcript_55371/g.106788 Transcript_55371/m.106788 type:complete len:202 (+) Transcript_55371:760-1365(+)
MRSPLEAFAAPTRGVPTALQPHPSRLSSNDAAAASSAVLLPAPALGPAACCAHSAALLPAAPTQHWRRRFARHRTAQPRQVSQHAAPENVVPPVRQRETIYILAAVSEVLQRPPRPGLRPNGPPPERSPPDEACHGLLYSAAVSYHDFVARPRAFLQQPLSGWLPPHVLLFFGKVALLAWQHPSPWPDIPVSGMQAMQHTP